jgi:multiple sugar transport system ATP-binding protein
MTLGHRVAVLHEGRLQQCGPPRELYDRPANTFVAGFIGSPAMNLCSVPVGSNGSVSFGGERVALSGGAAAAASAGGWDRIVLGVRPESLELAAEGVPARVEVVEELGADTFLFCSAEVGDGPARLVARVASRNAPDRGARIALRPRPAETHLFDPESGVRLTA